MAVFGCTNTVAGSSRAARWLLLFGVIAALGASCGQKAASDHHAAARAGFPCVECHRPDYDTATAPDHVAGGYPTTCKQCHSLEAWRPATFGDHASWPLTGAHADATCAACHSGGVYAGTARECAGCHTPDFEATTKPDHAAAGFPKTCELCHGTVAWVPSTFDHEAAWPLTGAHVEAACSGCHSTGYAGTSRECQGCHLTDWETAADPDHVKLALPKTCEACHATAAWKPADYAGHDAIWPLLGKHADEACTSCHGDGYANTPTDCVACHQDDYDATKDPNHAEVGYPTSCAVCHSAAGWKPAIFDHDVKWPLTGAHAVAACESCHADGHYADTPDTCVGCHQADYDGTKDPVHAALGLPTTCETCHGTLKWAPADFAGHDAKWPLLGKHAEATCESCHADGYTNTPTACDSCHHKDFVGASKPDHAGPGYPLDCALCHDPAGWTSPFDHTAKWPLTGAHADAQCSSCHADQVFAGTVDTCVGCHQADYDTTKDPDHAALGLPTTCGVCHGTAAWKPAAFDGHGDIWPLLDKHADATCESCHATGYTNTPTACDGCHHTDFLGATKPNHAGPGYPLDCALCHAPTGWTSAFDHATKWALTGAHTDAQCSSCHANQEFAGTEKTCVGCHQADFTAAKDPDHTALALPTTCETCHATSGWSPAKFADHAAKWPLLGEHANATCQSCHAAGYINTPTTCDGCHHADYVGSLSPDHAADGYPLKCETCHGPAGWQPSSFDHATKWQLTGAHVDAQCSSCHANQEFAGTAKTCKGCHLDKFLATTEPDHVTLGFPQTCDVCHSTAAWKPSQFEGHDAIWPLAGKHADATCESCHATGYTNTPTACDSCHHTEYLDAATPDHDGLGYPTSCESCHAPAGWKPTTFNHTAWWALTGAHTTTGCAQCHVGGKGPGIPTTCNGCHADDYAAATNPSHTKWALSTACETCHSTSAWPPATFTKTIHSKFFTLTGGSNHKDFSCTDCHKTPQWSDWICVSCHTGEHTLSKMDNKHNGDVPKYSSTMAAAATPDLGCKSCHPKGAK